MSDAMTPAIRLWQDAARRFLATSAGLDQARWAAARSGRPRIADIAEHAAISNQLFIARLARLATAPDSPSPSPLEDGEIAHLFERAAEPPGIAVPTGDWTEQAAALPRLAAAFAVPAAPDPGIDMRRRLAPHPLFGPMDGVQWALFAAAHAERHRSEIIGLAAD